MNALAASICSRALAGSTGALEWSDARGQRVVYFEAGAVVMVQSNLDSGAEDALARLTGCLRERGGEMQWRDDVAPPQRDPADLSEAILAAGSPGPSANSYLKVVGCGAAWFGRLPIEPQLAEYLMGLDGTRTTEEVGSFAPGGPDAAERWLRVGFAVGALSDVGIESATYEVRSVKRPRSTASDDTDIAAMISEGLGLPPPPPRPAAPAPDAATVRFGPVLQRLRESKNHFETLGVTWQDPPDTLRRAYVALARELHPDRFLGGPDELRSMAEEFFNRVRDAWEVLSDDTRREAYIKREVHGEKSEDELAMDTVRIILDAESDFKRALLDFSAGRLGPAHETFTRCASTVPDQPEFAAYAAFTTFKINQTRDPKLAAEGLARLTATLETNEKVDTAWVLLGQAHQARGDIDAAREAFVKALRIRPSNPDALAWMKRLEREKPPPKEPGGGLFRKFFGGK